MRWCGCGRAGLDIQRSTFALENTVALSIFSIEGCGIVNARTRALGTRHTVLEIFADARMGSDSVSERVILDSDKLEAEQV